MSDAVDPQEFHDRVIEGTDGFRTITLSAQDGAELENVEMHPVSKGTLTQAIEAMPDSVFEAVEDADEDMSAEEAEELAQQQGGAQVTEDMYWAFEKLCEESLEHEGLSKTQMELIIGEFAFDVVFELGSEVLTFSIEESGNVRDFREQS